MLKKIIVLLFIHCVSLIAFCQTDDSKKYKLLTRESHLGVGSLRLIDPYLSPVSYSGFSVVADALGRRFVSIDNPNLSNQYQFNASVGLLTNEVGTASMMYVGAQAGWGMMYHFRFASNFQLLTGGIVDGEFGFKWLARNVNNPVNMDLAIQLNAAAEARYDFDLWRQPLRLSLRFQSPIAGGMFVPLVGASYYEMFELGGLSQAFHFSSLHNKLALVSNLTLHIPIRKVTLLVGVSFNNSVYKANDLVFKHHLNYFNVGFKTDIFQFGAKQNVAPSSFLTTDK